MKQKILFSAIFSLLFFSACQAPAPLGSVDTDVSQIRVPEKWLNHHSEYASKHKQEWWRNFHNPRLNQLIEQALINNSNLQASALTWKKARLQIDAAELDQGVSFNGSASTNASRRFSGNQNSHSFGTSLSASYQLDLWNKLEISTQNAVWSANASAEDLFAAKLSLQGEVARAYLKLVYLHERLALNAVQLKTQEQTYSLVETRLKLGKSSELERLNAHQALANLKNSRTALLAQEKQAENALNLLLGNPPQKFVLGKVKLKDFQIPKIAAGIPADLLRQRPDLRAAQYRLQQDLGSVAINERDFYPDISLSASLSTGGSLLREILQNPVAGIAASLALPFLQQREKTLSLKSSQVQYEADLAKFRHSLYQALADVEDALIAISEIRSANTQIAARLKDGQRVAELTRLRYQAGKDSLNDLLTAQQSLHNLEQEMLENRYQHLLRVIDLYLALGGDTRPLQNEIIPIEQ